MPLSSPLSHIRAVFFDIDDTLLDFHSCAGLALRGAFSAVGLSFREEYFPTFHRENNALWKRIEEGTLSHAELHQIRFRLLFEALGITGDYATAEETFRAYLRTAAVPIVGAAETLSALKGAGYRLYAASNASHKEQGNRLKKAGLLDHIEDVVVSSDVGAAKPSAAFFHVCLARAGVSPDECVMIGDNVFADVGGALGVGMHAVWLNPMGACLPDGIAPDAVIASISDAKNLLLPKKG